MWTRQLCCPAAAAAAAALFLASQVAAKLMLVSSFVAAHSIAQQVLGAHLTASQHADEAPADSNSINGSQEQPHKKQAAAPAGIGGSDGDMAVAQQVLQESRAEADAALQYAHEVSRSRG